MRTMAQVPSEPRMATDLRKKRVTFQEGNETLPNPLTNQPTGTEASAKERQMPELLMITEPSPLASGPNTRSSPDRIRDDNCRYPSRYQRGHPEEETSVTNEYRDQPAGTWTGDSFPVRSSLALRSPVPGTSADSPREDCPICDDPGSGKSASYQEWLTEIRAQENPD